tara:strand:+ start:627 stop:752 length:126 start_codon:yes stop_codon:yes gene_type:complete
MLMAVEEQQVTLVFQSPILKGVLQGQVVQAEQGMGVVLNLI